MALFYPFDDTLNGRVEDVQLVISTMTSPIFTFPKGSFFVDQTYGFAGTRVLKPGIDYLVLSCNETIDYSADATLNNKLKNSYTRNAILLLTTEYPIITWNVAYAGGEETTKPNEYASYIQTLTAQAAAAGTLDEFESPHQGWANFLSAERKQITSGKHIHALDWGTQEDLDLSNGIGIGWGKMELAFQALADTMVNGTDPLLLQAYYHWYRHNDLLLQRRIDEVKGQLEAKKVQVSYTRVSPEQYIFKDNNDPLPNQLFIEHPNKMLRANGPNQPIQNLADLVYTYSTNVGFYTLASGGSRHTVKPTKLLQRKPKGFVDNRISVNVNMVQEGVNNIVVRLTHEGTAIPQARLAIVSQKLGKIIYTGVNAFTVNGTSTHNVSYPVGDLESAGDLIYAYLIPKETNGVELRGKVADMCLFQSRVTKDRYSLGVYGDNNVLTDRDVDGDFVTHVGLVVRRTNTTATDAMHIRIKDGNVDGDVVTLPVNDPLNGFSLATGASEIQLLLKLVGLPIRNNYITLELVYGTDKASEMVLETLLLPLRKSPSLIYANSCLMDIDDLDVPSFEAHRGSLNYMKVNFGSDTRFFNSNPVLTIKSDQNIRPTVAVNSYIQLSATEVLVVFQLSASADGWATISVTNTSGTLVSNNVNVSISARNGIAIPTPVFKVPVHGLNIVQTLGERGWSYQLNLELAVNVSNGIAVTGFSGAAGVSFPFSVTVVNNRIQLDASTTGQVNQAYRLSMSIGGTATFIDIPANPYPASTDFFYAEYADGTVSRDLIEMHRLFRLRYRNHDGGVRGTFTEKVFNPVLGINSIKTTQGNGVFARNNTAFSGAGHTTVSLGDYISITELDSTYPSLGNAEVGVVGLFAPNLNMQLTRISDGVSLLNGDAFTHRGSFKVINKTSLDSINAITRNDTFKMSDASVDVSATAKGSTFAGSVASIVVTTAEQGVVTLVGTPTYSVVRGTMVFKFKANLNTANLHEHKQITFKIAVKNSAGTTIANLESVLKKA